MMRYRELVLMFGPLTPGGLVLLRRRGLIFGVLVASQLLTGCTSWQVVSVSPRVFVDSAHVSAVQVREKGGIKYILSAPRVAGDSLFGDVWRVIPANPKTWQPRYEERVARAIPLATIDRVAVRGPDRPKTLGAILSVPAALVGLFFLAICTGGTLDCF